MKYELTPLDINKIERAINSDGAAEAVVRVEHGKLVVFVSRKKIVK